MDRLHEEIAMYEAQTLAQEEETKMAQKTLAEAVTEIEVCERRIRVISALLERLALTKGALICV